MKTENKTTRHVVGPIMPLIYGWQLEAMKKSYLSRVPEVNGIVFSNEGSKGREPLFDASRSKTKDIMAYWNDKEKGILEISAPEPGYELKTPKTMKDFFYGAVLSTKSPDKSSSRRHRFINGTSEKFISYLDVSHLDVSKTVNFQGCFWGFGQSTQSEIKGLETWDVSRGVEFRGMFENAFSDNETVSLDLSSWCFSETAEINMGSMFSNFASSAKSVTLNLDGWKTSMIENFTAMFDNFASKAIEVEVQGIEKWVIEHGNCFMFMFRNFALQSNYQLDLSYWNKKCEALPGDHYHFSAGTFFQIKEPKWAD